VAELQQRERDGVQRGGGMEPDQLRLLMAQFQELYMHQHKTNELLEKVVALLKEIRDRPPA
jgi:succinate dehydrogenase/fumarate reductase flavoprotein subunit